MVTKNQVNLIKAYLSPEDSASMPVEQAASLAEQMDAQAAAALEESVKTQLRLEEAALVANAALDMVFTDFELYR